MNAARLGAMSIIIALVLIVCVSHLCTARAAEGERYRINLGLELSEIYDDNTRLLDSARQDAFVTRISPRFLFERDFGATSLFSISYRGQHELSNEVTAQESTNVANLGFRTDPSPHSRMVLGNSFTYTSDPRDVVEDADQPDVIQNRTNLDLSYDGPSRLRLALNYAHLYQNYLQAGFDDRDANLDNIKVFYAFEFYRDIFFRFEPAFEVLYFNQPNTRDYNAPEVAGGVRWEKSDEFHVGAKGGFQWVNFDDATVNDLQGAVYGVDVMYKPLPNFNLLIYVGGDARSKLVSNTSLEYSYLEILRIRAGYERGTRVTYSTNNQFLVFDRPNLDATVYLLEDLKFHVSAYYLVERRTEVDPSIGTQRVDTFPRVDSKLSWQTGGRIMLSFFHTYWQRTSNLPGFDFHNHFAGAGIDLEFF